MSDDKRKKELEIKILKYVFGNEIEYEESEQPDFILKTGSNNEHGVEITELYYDGTSARIKNGRYINDLLVKNKYWHKDDKEKLKVQGVTYYSKEKGYFPTQLSVLFLPKYNLSDYAKAINETIVSKNEKLTKYRTSIFSNCMLVVYDKENPFEKIHEKDIARQLFCGVLSTTIRESGYQEIYLITGINHKRRYIPLKAYILQSDFLLFIEFIKKNELENKLNEKYNHPLFAFAEIIVRRGNEVFFGQVDNEEVLGGVVAYCGRYGIGMVMQDDNLGIGIFDTFPQKDIPNTMAFKLEESTDFFDDNLYKEYEKYVRENVASVGLNFPTK